MMTISDIQGEYSRRRMRAELLAERARDEALAAVPELAEVISRRDALSMERIRCALMPNGAERAAELTGEIAALRAQADRLCRQRGIDIGSFSPKYVCAKCADTGSVRTERGIEMCACMKREVYVKCLGAVDVGSLDVGFEDFRVDIFAEEHERRRMKAARDTCRKYAEKGEALGKRNILLTGKAGLGKTLLAGCMARTMDRSAPVLMLPSFDLFALFHKHRLGEFHMLAVIYDADVLIVDDLGSEPLTANVTREYALQLLDRRLSRDLPTVFTTNMDAANLRERYGERFASRLLADKTTASLMLEGEDLRQSGRLPRKKS